MSEYQIARSCASIYNSRLKGLTAAGFEWSLSTNRELLTDLLLSHAQAIYRSTCFDPKGNNRWDIQHRQTIINRAANQDGYLLQINSWRESMRGKKRSQTSYQGLTALNGFLKMLTRTDKSASNEKIVYQRIIKVYNHE